MSITNAFFEETKRSPIVLEKKYWRLLRKLIGILKWCKSSFDLPKMFSPWLWPFQKHNFWSISSENSGKISEKTRIGFISEDTAQIELVKKTNLKRNGILQYDMHFCQHQNQHNKDIANYRFSNFCPFSIHLKVSHQCATKSWEGVCPLGNFSHLIAFFSEGDPMQTPIVGHMV